MALRSDILAKDARIQEAYRDRNRPLALGEPQSIPVARIQWALHLLKYALPRSISVDGPDGIFGQETLAVVRRFQNDKHIRVDGMVGQHTLDALDMALTAVAPTPAPPLNQPADLRILWQPTSISTADGPNRLLGYLTKALELLKPFDMGIVSTFQIPDLVVPFDNVVNTNEFDGTDVDQVRQSAERQRPGMRDTLRVIVCRFDSRTRDIGDTFGGPTETKPQLSHWSQDFIVLDSRRFGADRCTLLHEMIHATGLEEHDQDPTSVFFRMGDQRTVLKLEHARRLSGAFFARPR
jgi:peptidoglycan hydrolase-like protein with peptidoglycan-binding domain